MCNYSRKAVDASGIPTVGVAPTLSVGNASYTANKNVANGSVLDTKETFLHFGSSEVGTKAQRNSFITSYYRNRNLQLANKIETHTRGFEPEINKVVRNLRWCSSVAMVQHNNYENASILETSKNCKNPHCSICARNRSTKLTNRLVDAIKDPGNKERFDYKHFYFLTLTVKHNEHTRNGIYLEEFNKYFNSLVRSKLWKDYFPTTKVNDIPLSGWIHNRECTITQNGYHIHAHILICCPKLKGKITKIESKIRAKWLKITGDSDIIRLDLIKFNKQKLLKNTLNSATQNAVNQQSSSSTATAASSIDFGAIREVFKYSVKAGPMRDMDTNTTQGKEKLDRYIEWILATKGKNFINCSGLFRGLQLTGAKSKYDKKGDVQELVEDAEYALVKTSDIRFNYRTNYEYTKSYRKQLLPRVYLKKLGKSARDVTDIANEMRTYLRISKDDTEIIDAFDRWIDYERKAKKERDFYLRLADEEDFGEESKANVAAMIKQFELFDNSTRKGNSGGFDSEQYMKV